MKIGLLVLIGIPASGKTTLAKTLINNYQKHNATAFHFVLVSYDELIPMEIQSRRFDWKVARYSLSLKIEKLIVSIKNKDVGSCPEEFKSQLQSIKSWDSNFVLIIDDNMYFKSMRYNLFQIAKKQSIGFCQVYIDCPLDYALLRNSLRSPKQIIPPEIIEIMNYKIEPPNYRNFWEKYSVVLDPRCDLHRVSPVVILVLNDSLDHCFCDNDDGEARELSKLQCRKSVLHQVDIVLRRVVGCIIRKCLSESSKPECDEYINSLKVRKSEIFADIKSGNICLPKNVLEEIDNDQLGAEISLLQYLTGL